MELLSVHIDNYEGPLDLLIHLVHRNEMNIFDVPVSEITNQFILEIRRMQELDMEIAAEFIHMASYLIYLKSRSLLPSGSTAGEEISIEEESFNLAQALVDLSYCKELAVRLKEFADYSGRYLLRREGILIPKESVLSEDPYRLANAYFESAQIKPEEKVVVHSTREQSEAIAAQTKKIVLERKDTLWSEISPVFPESFEKAVAFSTILDLSKQRLIRSIQESNFTDILMQRLNTV